MWIIKDSSMTKKNIIHQFNPTIYPRKLWVMKGGSIDDILDAFTEPDGQEIRIITSGGAEPGAEEQQSEGEAFMVGELRGEKLKGRGKLRSGGRPQDGAGRCWDGRCA